MTSIGASSSSLSDPPSPSGALLFVVFVAFHLHDHFLEHRRPLVEGQVARDGAHCGHRLKGVAGLGILGTFVDRMSGREKNRGGRPICQHLRVRSQHRHTNIYVRRRHSHGEREEHPGHAPCPHPPPLRRPLQRLPQPPQRPPPPVHLDVHHVPPEILVLLRVVARPVPRNNRTTCATSPTQCARAVGQDDPRPARRCGNSSVAATRVHAASPSAAAVTKARRAAACHRPRTPSSSYRKWSALQTHGTRRATSPPAASVQPAGRPRAASAGRMAS